MRWGAVVTQLVGEELRDIGELREDKSKPTHWEPETPQSQESGSEIHFSISSTLHGPSILTLWLPLCLLCKIYPWDLDELYHTERKGRHLFSEQNTFLYFPIRPPPLIIVDMYVASIGGVKPFNSLTSVVSVCRLLSMWVSSWHENVSQFANLQKEKGIPSYP